MISFSHQTDTGKKRDHNEDFYELNDELGVYIVCDGMGGHAAGEVASEMTATTILKILEKNQKVFLSLKSPDDSLKRKRISELIKKAVDEANRAVYQMSMEDPSKRGMGTTLVMAIVTEVGTFVAHVGDSRAYLIRKGNVQQLTEDHSLVNEMVRSGVISKEQAMNHPQGNVITKAIGIQEVISPDVLFYETMEGDTIFLCSDGLHDYLKKEDVLSIRGKNTIKTLASEFVKFANFKGGKDNITCICLQFGDIEAPPAHPSNITVDTKIQTLKKIPLFAGLNYKEISQILEIIQIRNIEPGTQIITEGKSGEDMFVILKGHVSVSVQGQEVNQLKPGQFFGEMSLIDKSPRSASIVTIDEVKVMRLTRSDFFPLLKKESRIGLKVFWAFLQNMNKRLRDNDKLVFSMTQEQMGAKDPFTGKDENPDKGDFDLSMLDK